MQAYTYSQTIRIIILETDKVKTRFISVLGEHGGKSRLGTD